MASIEQTFPAFAEIALHDEAREVLAYEFDPVDRAALLSVIASFGAIADEQGAEVEALIAAGTRLLDEIDSQLPAETSAHDTLVFAVATFTAEILQDRGEQIGTLALLHRARAVQSGDGGWSPRPERLRLWAPMADRLDLLLLEVTLRHFAASFAAAWRRPELDELTDVLWVNASPAILQAVDMKAGDLARSGLDGDAAVMWAAEASLHRMQWALRSGRQDAREEYGLWVPLADDPDSPAWLRKMILSFGASSTQPVSERPQDELAETLLREFEGDLTPPLVLRALCSACGGREDELLDRLPAIVDACERHREFDPANEGVLERAYSRSQNTPAVAWALRTLVHHRRITEAMMLLRAWRPEEPDGPAPETPFFVLPTSRVGTVWAWEGEIAPSPDGPEIRTLPVLTRAVEETFATWYELRSDRPWDEAEVTAGLPVAAEAANYLRRTEEHLRLDAARAVSSGVPETALLVPWPMMRVPLQALLMRHVGRSWPICASLSEPRAERAPRRVVVMGSGSQTSDIEREAVCECFGAIGIDVTDAGAATLGAFADSYEDPEVDILWLCSHGTQHPARPHQSGLFLDDGEFLALPQLARLSVPQRSDRRLLVLNVCDAGAAPMMEGSWALGVAAALARPTQSVLSHMWPVNPIVAAAFAALLASEIALGGPGHFASFGRALTRLMTGQESIAETLRARRLFDVAARVENNDVSWDSVLSWGAPVFVT
jgi:hypothetical protein